MLASLHFTLKQINQASKKSLSSPKINWFHSQQQRIIHPVYKPIQNTRNVFTKSSHNSSAVIFFRKQMAAKIKMFLLICHGFWPFVQSSTLHYPYLAYLFLGFFCFRKAKNLTPASKPWVLTARPAGAHRFAILATPENLRPPMHRHSWCTVTECWTVAVLSEGSLMNTPVSSTELFFFLETYAYITVSNI